MRRLLLDTHALLWWLTDDACLGEKARKQIADPANLVFVSAASIWEISIACCSPRHRPKG
ncbi:PIN domain-containing protein [Serratia liquefaciens]|uniref:PIN domain-containing protein n=1 Tax=Serratia liquefaciens TaxID=614 RepID=UPI00380FBB0F